MNVHRRQNRPPGRNCPQARCSNHSNWWDDGRKFVCRRHLLQPYNMKKKRQKKIRWTHTMNQRLSLIRIWTHIGETTSTLVDNTLKVVRNLWTPLPNHLQFWDGRLSCINIVKHCIELTAPDVHPTKPSSYRAEPKTWELKKAENDNMLCMKVIEPASSEWASLIVFAQNNDGLIR